MGLMLATLPFFLLGGILVSSKKGGLYGFAAWVVCWILLFFFYDPLAFLGAIAIIFVGFLGATIAGLFLKLFGTPDWLTCIGAAIAFFYTTEGVKSLIEWIVK